MKQNLMLALKFLWRELVSGELRLLMLSLIIATASLSSIGFLINKINDSMTDHASQLNGAQLTIKSPHAIKAQWLNKARELQLKQAQMRVFPSMLVVGEQFKLAQIKAVSDNFPLQGQLMVKRFRLTEVGLSAAQAEKAPPPGSIWLDKRLVDYFQLNKILQKQEPVEVGKAEFQVGGILERVPGQSSSLLRIAPTALINLEDLDKTATVQVGSRIDYIYFFSGSKKALSRFRQWLKPQLQDSQTLIAGIEDVKALNVSLKKAGEYLSLAAILTVFLSAIAIVINTLRYGRSHYKNQAIMLCLGCRENQLLAIEMIKLLLTGIFSALLGILSGFLVYAGIVMLINDLMTDSGITFYFKPVLLSFFGGLLLLFSISLANLLRLKKIAPVSLIRNENLNTDLQTKLLYLLGLTGPVLIACLYTGNLKLTLIFYSSILCASLVLHFFAKILLAGVLSVSAKYHWINRLTLLNLERHHQGALLQITTFSIIFALLIIIFLLHNELLEKWQQQFPEQTPNHFVINIQSYEQQDFKQFLTAQAIKSNGLYPMVRGRLIRLNQQPVKAVVPDQAKNHNALNRELNLSVSNTVPGIKHRQSRQNEWPEISVEQSLAKALAINKGDRLDFQIGDKTIAGIVTEFRTVKWDSFEPNFYIIFSPGLIEQYPMSWMGSFYLAKEDKYKLNKMLARFPGVTIIEVDEVLKEIQLIINKISQAIEVIFLFIMVAGLLILGSSLSSTLESRMYENAVIRTLGASARQLRKCLWVEFTIIALVSAFIAIMLAEFSSYFLYQQIFNINFALHPQLWIVVTLLAIILISGLGLWITNKIYTRTSYQSLRLLGH